MIWPGRLAKYPWTGLAKRGEFSMRVMTREVATQARIAMHRNAVYQVILVRVLDNAPIDNLGFVSRAELQVFARDMAPRSVDVLWAQGEDETSLQSFVRLAAAGTVEREA